MNTYSILQSISPYLIHVVAFIVVNATPVGLQCSLSKNGTHFIVECVTSGIEVIECRLDAGPLEEC